MNLDCFDNKILIIKDHAKDSLLKLINNSNKLLNIKLITLSELKKKYFFDYGNEALYFVCRKFNLSPKIAKVYLENLYYINEYDDKKINFLNSIKSDLEKNNLLIKNELFVDYLNSHYVVLFDLDNVDKFYNKIFDSLKNVSRYSFEVIDGKKELIVCSNRNEEIEYVASSICALIKKGIDINNIKIANVSSEYNFIIKNIFKVYNIKVNLDSDESIKGTRIVKVFKKFYDCGIDASFKKIQELIKGEKDNNIFRQIINIINEFSFINDYSLSKEFIFDKIDNTKIKVDKYKNAVNIVDIEEDIISDDEYVFMINYTEGALPHNYKDEDYLSDKLKSILGLSASYELNNNSLSSLISAIKRVKNLTITYPKRDVNGELYLSSSFDENILDIKVSDIGFNHSNLYNKLKLVSLLDEFKKYGTTTDELIILNNHYKDIKYLSFDNKYNGINAEELYDFLNKKLVLSYSSLNDYFSCSFKYYLNYILKLNEYNETFDTVIGNIFHGVLSECFSMDFDFDKSYEEKILKSKYEFNNSEKFFLEKLKKDLQLIIKTIKNQLNYTHLDKFMYEKEIKIAINEELNITFKGFIDKLMYKEVDGFNIVAIVDYKTGNPSLNINNCIYGLDMQLPIYMYLIKNSNLLKNVKIGGLYLQKILGSSKTEEEKINNLKLVGYSNSDINILDYVDSSYANSDIISGLRVKNDGSFYSNSKVISDENIDYLTNIVKEKIAEASTGILDAKFDINPKVINNINRGCMYCKYKDICYMKNENIINCKSAPNIFGGDDNE